LQYEIPTGDLQALLDYYANLLIIQYHDLPKAKATIQALCSALTPINQATGNLLIKDIRDAFNIDTAVGVQLDTIGEYVGVDRFWSGINLNGNYFGYVDAYEDITNVPQCGYSDAYVTPTQDAGYLDANSLLSVTNKLTDSDFRLLIKLKILQNVSNHSWASLVNGLYQIFGDSIYISTCNNGKMSYFVPSDLPPLIQAMATKGILPRPMGITISGLIPELSEGSYFGFVDAYNPDISNVPVCGFEDAYGAADYYSLISDVPDMDTLLDVDTLLYNLGTANGGHILDSNLVLSV
jgi:hypothetical protein